MKIHSRQLASVLLALGASACAATGTAIEVTRQVETASTTATGVLNRLAAAQKDELESLQSLATGASTSAVTLRKEATRQQMAAVVADAKRGLEADRANFVLKDLRGLETRALESLDSRFKGILKVSYDRAATLDAAAKDAQSQSERYPDELPLRAAAKEASLRYFAWVAAVNEIETEARDRARSEIRKRLESAEQRIQDFVATQDEKLEALLKQSSADLDKEGAATASTVPDPMAGDLEQLRAYTAAVIEAQAALRGYLEATDIGAGNALLKQFISSARSSLVGGATQKDASKLPTISDAVDQWKSLGAEALAGLKTQAADVKAGFAGFQRDQINVGQAELDNAIGNLLSSIKQPSAPK